MPNKGGRPGLQRGEETGVMRPAALRLHANGLASPRSPQKRCRARPLSCTHPGGLGSHPPAPFAAERSKAPPLPPPRAAPPSPAFSPPPTERTGGGTGGSARAPSPSGGGDITATAGGAAPRTSLPRRLPPARTDGRLAGGGQRRADRGPARGGASGASVRCAAPGSRRPRPHGGSGPARR